LSIDEDRTTFQRVPWGERDTLNAADACGLNWFEQIWFAGNHSDIGGSYCENDSRLSDVTLQWMVDAAGAAGLHYDAQYLSLFPDATGPQHDERQSSLFRYTRGKARFVPPEAVLHPSVMDRFAAADVLHYNVLKPYRPENLRGHGGTSAFYP
jgi:hypothetical protein